MTDKEKYDFIDHVVHLTLFEEDVLLNEHGGDYDGLEEDGIDSNEYYRIITERVIDTLKKNNNYMQEEPVSEDLEEAVDGYTRKVLERTNCLIGNQSVGEEISKAVEFGANWHKEQMMKDAVGGYVIEDTEEGNGDFLLSADYLPASMGLKDKQKVKVIILKDE